MLYSNYKNLNNVQAVLAKMGCNDDVISYVLKELRIRNSSIDDLFETIKIFENNKGEPPHKSIIIKRIDGSKGFVDYNPYNGVLVLRVPNKSSYVVMSEFIELCNKILDDEHIAYRCTGIIRFNKKSSSYKVRLADIRKRMCKLYELSV